MSDDSEIVPVWTLSGDGNSAVPDLLDGSMTIDRLEDLRSVLAAINSRPVATLERHPLPKGLDYSTGIVLDSASPLAAHLTDLVAATTHALASSASGAGETAARLAQSTGDGLFRMVLPANVASKMGQGLIQPMASKVAAGGIRSALTNSAGRIAGHATFVPVAAEGTAAATAGGAAAVGASVIAAPLILMAASAAFSAYADYQRQKQMAAVLKILHELRAENLDRERADLEACRPAVDKATALLLDKGVVGHALGLDSAIHAVSTAISTAGSRLTRWVNSLDTLTERNGSAKVEAGRLAAAFPGIDAPNGGEFRAHLELARLAIVLQRRLLILQAVEAAQSNAGNGLDAFMKSLRTDQVAVDRLDRDLAKLLLDLSTLELDRKHRWNDVVFTPGEVDELLQRVRLARGLGDGIAVDRPATNVAIEVARKSDGTVVVFPAMIA